MQPQDPQDAAHASSDPNPSAGTSQPAADDSNDASYDFNEHVQELRTAFEEYESVNGGGAGAKNNGITYS